MTASVGPAFIPTTQAFDSVNFVDCFLSSDVLQEGTDKQANVVEALSYFQRWSLGQAESEEQTLPALFVDANWKSGHVQEAAHASHAVASTRDRVHLTWFILILYNLLTDVVKIPVAPQLVDLLFYVYLWSLCADQIFWSRQVFFIMCVSSVRNATDA